MLELPLLLGLSALSGLFALDATGALQVMLSRPLVAAALAGAMMGDLGAGLAVGSLVELLWIGTVPVGSVVPPDGTSAAVVGAAVAVGLAQASGHPHSQDAAGALGVLASIPVGYFGARAEIFQRRLNGRLSSKVEQALQAGKDPGIAKVLCLALFLAWLRASLVCGLGLALVPPFFAFVLKGLPKEGVLALHWCFWLFWLMALAVVADHFWQRRGLKWAGLACIITAVVAANHTLPYLLVVSLAFGLSGVAGLWRWRRALKGEAP